MVVVSFDTQTCPLRSEHIVICQKQVTGHLTELPGF